MPPPGTRSTPKKKAVRLSLKAFRLWHPPSGRGWAELPVELLLCVFHVLGPVELLSGGAARHEPLLWCHIDMRGYANPCVRWHVPFSVLVWASLPLSVRKCQAFWTDASDADFVLQLLFEQ